ncbi:hypothetical protein B0T10DRAFT_213636 [Thelonectria olida]|uniref:RING-type domain-containing protein n=1 Tax=Thelonectria olida TaxID=1576542 RepID=A0A9P8WC38_9HYPO|nr:hypothetical protein B0T10DRAFT_213636 [Thelonectria olida]
MTLQRPLPQMGKYLRTKRLENNQTHTDTKPTVTNHGTTGRVTSWVRSKVLPFFLSWSQPHRNYNPDECFFPFPKITFLIDQPQGLMCQICRESECELKSEGKPIDDSTFSIMPCGHAAGTKCLEAWLRTKSSCPFCRLTLSYPACGHPVPLRPLTTTSIHNVPVTLPDGGHVRDLCKSCHRSSLVEEATPKVRLAASLFRNARRRYHETKHEVDAEALLKRRQEVETVARDEIHVRHFTTWLTSW